MTLTIGFKSEGTHTETVRDLDHGFDRAEEIAEAIGMTSRASMSQTVMLTSANDNRVFFGYVD